MNELLASFDNCLIYKVNSKKTQVYYLCVPVMDTDNYQMFLGFPDVDLSKLSKEELINKIKEVAYNIQTINYNSVYVLPDISLSYLEEAALENDNPYYNKILREIIQPITVAVYEMLIKTNYGKKKMNRTINVIKKSDSDKKFVGWLSMMFGEINIKEIDYNRLCKNNAMSEEVPVNYSLTLSDYQDKDYSLQIKNDNGITKKLMSLKKKNINISSGFGNVKFIIVTLICSLAVGFVIANVLIK